MVDLSVFQKIKTPTDFARIDEEFKARKTQRELQNFALKEKIKNMGKKNPEEIASDAIFNYYKTGQLNPEGKAAIETLAAMEGNKTQYSRDALGNLTPTTAPNQYSQFLGGLNQTAQPIPQESEYPPAEDFGADPFGGGYNNRVDYKVPDIQGNALPPMPQGLNPMVANSPQGLLEAYKANLDMQKEEAKANIKSEADEQESLSQDMDTLNSVLGMAINNTGTWQIPYAGALQPVTRITDDAAAGNMSSMNQKRLRLAAPLAKMLGVNPTDKDFQNTLDQIFNDNDSGKNRFMQLSNLVSDIERKRGLPTEFKQRWDLVSKAQEAINRGADPEQVNQRLLQVLNGQ